MVLVSGTPLLERLVEMAKANGLSDFVFLTGYKAEAIEDHFGDGDKFGVRIEHVPRRGRSAPPAPFALRGISSMRRSSCCTATS